MVYMAYKDLYQMSNTEVRPLTTWPPMHGDSTRAGHRAAEVTGSLLHPLGLRISSFPPLLPSEGCPRLRARCAGCQGAGLPCCWERRGSGVGSLRASTGGHSLRRAHQALPRRGLRLKGRAGSGAGAAQGSLSAP